MSFILSDNMVELVGPIVRPISIDPLELSAWPIACALAWIIANDEALSPNQRDELVRQAYRHEARALPVDALTASLKLIDYAVSHPDNLVLHYPGGVIKPSQLGPDALIFPTKDRSGILTFGLRVHATIGSMDDIRQKHLGVWCLAREVQAAWPHRAMLEAPEKRGQKRRHCSMGPAILAADKEAYPDGPPLGTPASVRRNRIIKILDRDNIRAPSAKTFQRCGIGAT